MSDTGPVTATVTAPSVSSDPAADGGAPKDDDATKPDVDWKARSREWEKRAKANADAADRLAQMEEAQKTEAQRSADRAAKAEQELTAARTDALRFRVATKYGISDEDAETFLTGGDEEAIVRQAERLAALAKPGAPRPDPSQGPRGDTVSGDMNTLIRRGLRSGG